jgi:hypothetical protein
MAIKITPQQDTGWGVIYRLNGLFAEVEELAPLGRYDDWNFKLDRIWSNLCYRNNLDIKRTPDKKIIEIKLCSDDVDVKEYFDKQIKIVKSKMNAVRKKSPDGKTIPKNLNKEYKIAKNELYNWLMLKEIWLRKHMRELKLYLKEIKSNPSGAMWGNESN